MSCSASACCFFQQVLGCVTETWAMFLTGLGRFGVGIRSAHHMSESIIHVRCPTRCYTWNDPSLNSRGRLLAAAEGRCLVSHECIHNTPSRLRKTRIIKTDSIWSGHPKSHPVTRPRMKEEGVGGVNCRHLIFLFL
ncbi:hypothetical protein BJY01DRAFT_205036 [Aspergillus pseudoustus]|uniref:Secreted protein n=1 Tax=Aspergillus pseudoustus TaxID=1810923 RepID=A0ABR4KRK3_9EURO